MTPAQDTRLVVLGTRVYRALLTLYPAAFRHEYGAQIAQVFHDRCRDEQHRHGTIGLIAFWLTALIDLWRTALAERNLADHQVAADEADRTKARVYRLLLQAGVCLLVGASVAMVNIWAVEYQAHLFDVLGWLLLVLCILALPLLPLMLTNLLIHGTHYRAARYCVVVTVGACVSSACFVGAGTVNSFFEGGYHPDQGLWGGVLFTFAGCSAIALVFGAGRAIRDVQILEGS